ncbi:MAG TPA: alpha amylase C-terminal domain-containing protein, partial [Candidatus Bipolaricaulota bacterium]
KLLFMGAELAEWREWQHEESLDWRLLDFPAHAGMRRWVEDLNRLYRREPALQLDFEPAGFEWIDCNDAGGSTLSFLRKGSFNEEMLVACNFTPVPRRDYRLGAARDGRWQEVLSSDAQLYGGSGHFHHERIETQAVPWHGRPCSVLVNLPPLAVVFFKREV